MAKVAFDAVEKRFGNVEVLKGVKLDIESGEFAVIVGPSGCGKSTMLRIMAGLEEMSGGSVSIDGRNLDGLSPGERGIAMVFQSYALYPHKTVFDNIAFPLLITGASRETIKQKVDEAARILQIEHLVDRKPRQLSGGQKQRVAIGRAIVRQPKVFLFDEPLSNLDADLRGQMRAEIVRLHKLLGATMLYVTHDQIEAMTMADRIVVMKDGVVQQIGKPLELFEVPANKFVASFIGSPKMNFIDCSATVAEDRLQLMLGERKSGISVPNKSQFAPSELRTMGVRPDSIALENIPNGYSQLDFDVERTELLGSRTRYFGSVASGIPFVVDVEGTPGQFDGRTCKIGLAPEKMHFFDKNGYSL